MTNRCVNPACRTELKRLNSGDLYALKRLDVVTDYFWLCSNCASTLIPVLDPLGIVSLKHREDSQSTNPPGSSSTLRLVAHARRHMPWQHTVPAGMRPLLENQRDWNTQAHGLA